MQDNNKDSMILTFITGAVLGAAAILLVDKGKRNEFKAKLDNFMGRIDDMKDKGKEKVESEIDKTKNNIRKMAS